MRAATLPLAPTKQSGSSEAHLTVYLKCSRCDAETPLTLPPDDYRRCGFAPDANLHGDVL
jgi:hypothetical protein